MTVDIFDEAIVRAKQDIGRKESAAASTEALAAEVIGKVLKQRVETIEIGRRAAKILLSSGLTPNLQVCNFTRGRRINLTDDGWLVAVGPRETGESAPGVNMHGEQGLFISRRHKGLATFTGDEITTGDPQLQGYRSIYDTQELSEEVIGDGVKWDMSTPDVNRSSGLILGATFKPDKPGFERHHVNQIETKIQTAVAHLLIDLNQV